MMNTNKNIKAQRVIKNHINKLGSIYEKKEAEQKIIDKNINYLKEELEILRNKAKDSAGTNAINWNQYIKTMGR
tara:strand:+ start:117 stop:338 length:222 start_codon:yes stop_codon:yes gene_type:complete